MKTKIYDYEASKRLIAALGAPAMDEKEVIAAIDAGADPNAEGRYMFTNMPRQERTLPALALAALVRGKCTSNEVMLKLVGAGADAHHANQSLILVASSFVGATKIRNDEKEHPQALVLLAMRDLTAVSRHVALNKPAFFPA